MQRFSRGYGLVPKTCCKDQSQGLVAGTGHLMCADLNRGIEPWFTATFFDIGHPCWSIGTWQNKVSADSIT